LTARKIFCCRPAACRPPKNHFTPASASPTSLCFILRLQRRRRPQPEKFQGGEGLAVLPSIYFWPDTAYLGCLHFISPWRGPRRVPQRLFLPGEAVFVAKLFFVDATDVPCCKNKIHFVN
jgi:hypothetical protein